MSEYAREIKPVYDDVVNHLKTFRDDRTTPLHFGAFGADIAKTDETFSIPLFHLTSLTIDPFLEHCRQHPCYLNSQITTNRNGHAVVWLNFYWTEQRPERNRAPRISKRVSFRDDENGPSVWELFGYVILGTSASIFGLTKNYLFGL